VGRGVQVVIDCADPDALTAFWAEALGYVVPQPPSGFDSWDDWYRSIGVPDDELDAGNDRLIDPDGTGPDFWFQKVPETKTVKNRVHVDIGVGGGRDVAVDVRKQRVDVLAEHLLAIGASVVRRHDQEVEGHYAVTLQDPEGNEFCLH
jgi:Glyoxalase-like domain